MPSESTGDKSRTELAERLEALATELRQREAQLAVINSVQDGLAAALDIETIYELVGERIRDLFDAQAVGIHTFDHEAGLYSFEYLFEDGARYYPEPRPIDAVRRRIIEARKMIVVNEGTADVYEEWTGEAAAVNVPGTSFPKSVIFLPMVVGETVRGYITLQDVEREHAFSESDIHLLSTLTSSMTMALENVRLFGEAKRLLEESRRRADELDTVNRISRALVSQLEFDTLMQLVGEQTRVTFEADIVYVALHDRETDMIHFPYEYGDKNPPREFGSGFTEKILTTRQPLLINHDLEERREELKAERIGRVPTSYLGVPIIVGDVPTGVISIQSTREESHYDERDMHLLTTIAANVGVAVANAESYRQLSAALAELQRTQQQLVMQEKLASLGQLTAGIAHEIKNPLNFVNNFGKLSGELVAELRQELAEHPAALAAVEDVLADLQTNAAKIEEHGRRADSIVRGMLAHSRGGGGKPEPVDVNALVEEYVGLAYHGKRAQSPDLTVELVRDLDPAVGILEIVPQDLGRVVLNLVGNAFDAVAERAGEPEYVARVRVATRRSADHVEIRVEDNGPGIPEDVRRRVFEPFFTTKETGKGTGLGLSMSHEIVVQGHGGRLEVKSREGEGATFVVTLPAS